jgi:hypothetical protein
MTVYVAFKYDDTAELEILGVYSHELSAIKRTCEDDIGRNTDTGVRAFELNEE